MRPLYRFSVASTRGLARLLWGLRLEGVENIPPTGAVLLTSNHVSQLDPPLVGSFVPREVGFAAKRELFGVPGLGRLIRALNAIPVDRSNLTRGTLRAFARWLGQEKVLIYFPEGTRSRDGRLRRPKVGVGMLLEHCPVTVVPARICGTDALLKNLFRRGRVRVVFGRPYTLPQEDGPGEEERREQYRRTADAVMDRIRELAPES